MKIPEIKLEDFTLEKYTLPACPTEYLDVNYNDEKVNFVFILKIKYFYIFILGTM